MNPRVKRILVYALVGGAVCVLLVSVVALPALSAAGFGILGPLAGSSAAAWQAAIGSVAAGSAFATLQSVAMTAAIPALWYIVPGAVGVGIGALIGWLTGGRNRPAAGATAAAPGAGSTIFAGQATGYPSGFRRGEGTHVAEVTMAASGDKTASGDEVAVKAS
ncbi:predicted protein [Postia placenta Mad-698-R]|uniref:Uncharacterized protein n=1 Tax=Postia placenta MAD-698-R-SB12 TaxID=670580 RepID=A0A1X6MW93_9APHY|nr:hypothetical protein POSPLADRAFT_1147607 [Postia placenta MAD-698-R-SB12]EED84426.1 predicted protein [Postia placenta Mad-698-R]OSX60645.1 hypothetical protein POSPLADRAFT_1147607 [Postia placenta MAD-698-R-SB12]